MAKSENSITATMENSTLNPIVFPGLPGLACLADSHADHLARVQLWHHGLHGSKQLHCDSRRWRHLLHPNIRVSVNPVSHTELFMSNCQRLPPGGLTNCREQDRFQLKWGRHHLFVKTRMEFDGRCCVYSRFVSTPGGRGNGRLSSDPNCTIHSSRAPVIMTFKGNCPCKHRPN